MGVNIKGRSYLKLLDYTSEEIRYLLDLSKQFKNMKRNGVPHKYLENKNIVLLFEKTSVNIFTDQDAAWLETNDNVHWLKGNKYFTWESLFFLSLHEI